MIQGLISLSSFTTSTTLLREKHIIHSTEDSWKKKLRLHRSKDSRNWAVMITVTTGLVFIEIILFGHCETSMKHLTRNTETTADYYHFTHGYTGQPTDYLDRVNVIPNLEKKDNFADQEISEQEAPQEGREITKIDKQAHHTSTVYERKISSLPKPVKDIPQNLVFCGSFKLH